MSGEDTIITMGGRRAKRVSKLLSLHVENEETEPSLRRRRVRVISPEDKNLTPDERLELSTDSGYLGGSLSSSIGSTSGSDPDWFLRPRKLSFEDYSANPGLDNVLGYRRSYTAKIKEFFGFGRPNFVDYDSPKWFFRTEAILGAVIVVTILACLGFCLMISAKLFSQDQAEMNGKYKSIKFAVEKKQLVNEEKIPVIEKNIKNPDLPSLHIPRQDEAEKVQAEESNLGSSEDRTPEIEVIDLMQDQSSKPAANLKPSQEVSKEPQMNTVPLADEEKPKTQQFKVEKVKDVKRKRFITKNKNPLTKAVEPEMMSKVKRKTPSPTVTKVVPVDLNDEVEVEDVAELSLDYPDDPTFRGNPDTPSESIIKDEV